MLDEGPILVTGAAGQLGAVGRTVAGLLLDRAFPVRAMVRREDDRAAALRAAGAEVVVGDLLEPADVYRVVSNCRRVCRRCRAGNRPAGDGRKVVCVSSRGSARGRQHFRPGHHRSESQYSQQVGHSEKSDIDSFEIRLQEQCSEPILAQR